MCVEWMRRKRRHQAELGEYKRCIGVDENMSGEHMHNRSIWRHGQSTPRRKDAEVL